MDFNEDDSADDEWQKMMAGTWEQTPEAGGAAAEEASAASPAQVEEHAAEGSPAPIFGDFEISDDENAEELALDDADVAEAENSEAVEEDAPAPVKEAPVARTPVSKAPVSKAPVSKAPVSKAPVSKAPVSKAPVGKAVVSKAPLSKAPLSKAPVAKAVAVGSPEPHASGVAKTVVAGKAPMSKTPAAKAPLAKAPLSKGAPAGNVAARPPAAKAPVARGTPDGKGPPAGKAPLSKAAPASGGLSKPTTPGAGTTAPAVRKGDAKGGKGVASSNIPGKGQGKNAQKAGGKAPKPATTEAKAVTSESADGKPVDARFEAAKLFITQARKRLPAAKIQELARQADDNANEALSGLAESVEKTDKLLRLKAKNLEKLIKNMEAEQQSGGGGGWGSKRPGAPIDGPLAKAPRPALFKDSEGRDFDLRTVVVNFANVGATYGKKCLGRHLWTWGFFDWEGVRRCVSFLRAEKKWKVSGVINENFTGTDAGSKSKTHKVPMPEDIRKLCDGGINETPRVTGSNHASADDEMTIKCSYRRNCRFLDNDNYRDWLQQLASEKVRVWLNENQELLQCRYFFDGGTGTFDLIEGNIPAHLLASKTAVTKEELWSLSRTS